MNQTNFNENATNNQGQNTATAQPALQIFATRKDYLSKHASPKAKKAALLTRVLGIAAAVLFLIGAFITLNTGLFDIPVVSMALGDMDDELDFGDMEEIEDEFDDMLDELEDDLTKKQEKELKNYIKTVKALIKTPSINNIKKFLSESEDIAELLADIDGSVSDEFVEDLIEDSGISTVEDVLGTISTVVWVFSLFLALFALLAGFRYSGGFAIAAIIINFLQGILFVGFLHVVIVSACLIAVVVFSKQVKSEFKLALLHQQMEIAKMNNQNVNA